MPQNATNKLEAKQLEVIDKLVDGITITDTAVVVKVDRSTIHRWFHKKKFIAEYDKAVNMRRMRRRGRAFDNLYRLSDSLNPAGVKMELQISGDLVEEHNIKGDINITLKKPEDVGLDE